MESLDAPPGVMKSIPVSLWMDFAQWAKDKYLSSLYRFLCYLLPSKDELKAMAIEPVPVESQRQDKKRGAQLGLF